MRAGAFSKAVPDTSLPLWLLDTKSLLGMLHGNGSDDVEKEVRIDPAILNPLNKGDHLSQKQFTWYQLT